jgi:hypothetical protein
MIDVASGVLYWYHYDGLGSVVALSKWNSGFSQGEGSSGIRMMPSAGRGYSTRPAAS